MLVIFMIPIVLQAPGSVYVTALATYSETTIANTILLIMLLALSVQVARKYFLRILRKFTLRLAADIWWLLFVLIRDASIFLVVLMGFMLFWPGTYQDFAIAVPFQPIAIDFFAMALVLMLLKDTDEDRFYNNLLTVFVIIGTSLYAIGTIFVTESAVQLAVLPPTVSVAASNIWGFFNLNFNSMNNPALSIYTFYVGIGVLALCGLIVTVYSFMDGAGKFSEPKPNPTIKETANPQQSQPLQTVQLPFPQSTPPPASLSRKGNENAAHNSLIHDLVQRIERIENGGKKPKGKGGKQRVIGKPQNKAGKAGAQGQDETEKS